MLNSVSEKLISIFSAEIVSDVCLSKTRHHDAWVFWVVARMLLIGLIQKKPPLSLYDILAPTYVLGLWDFSHF